MLVLGPRMTELNMLIEMLRAMCAEHTQTAWDTATRLAELLRTKVGLAMRFELKA
jgi:hypothetical protein